MPRRVQKQLIGLEIEPHGVTAAQATVEGGRLVVRRSGHEPLDPGVVPDGEVADPEALTAAIVRLWAGQKGLGRRVRVGIANQRIVTRILDLPVLRDDKELEAAVRFRAGDEIPMPLEAAVIDWQRLALVDTAEGPRQRVLLVAARKDMVLRLLEAVRAAGLRCEGIDLAAFALVRALHRHDREGDGHVLYLSVSGMTNLAIADGPTCLFTRATTGGFEALVAELAERRAITRDAAREVLLRTEVPHDATRADAPRPGGPLPGEIGGDVPDPAARPMRRAGAGDEPAVAWGAEEPTAELLPVDEGPETIPTAAHDDQEALAHEAGQILREGVRRIAADVRTSMEFHVGAGLDGRVGRVVLAGAAAGLPRFAEALAEQLNMPVDAADLPGAQDVGLVAVAAGLTLEEAPA